MATVLIPQNSWQLRPLAEMLSYPRSGYSIICDDESAVGLELGLLKLSAVVDGRLNTRENKRVPASEHSKLKSPLRKGTILVSRSNTPDLVGAIAFVEQDHPNLFLPDLLWECSVKDESVFDARWLAYALDSPHYRVQIRARASGTSPSMKKLTKPALLSMQVYCPDFEEQRRIVAVLSTWDREIEEAERLLVLKEQRKRALMQQLLTGKRRFPEFTVRWRKFSLSDLFEPVYRTATSEVDAVLSISSRKGFERQEKKYSKVIAGKNLENYILLQRGEFAYNKGNSKTYPQGCIFRLDDYAEAAVPNVYFNFRIKDSAQTDSDFFRSYFEAGLLNMGLRGLINTGIRNNGLLNIYEPGFYALTVRCPDVTEQRRIAAVLNTCDAELRHLRDEVAALKQQKKGLMQKLLTGQVRVPNRLDN